LPTNSREPEPPRWPEHPGGLALLGDPHMNISLTFSALDKIAQGLENSPKMAQRELLAAMAWSTGLLERETIEAFPKSKEVPVHPKAKHTPKRSPGETAQTIHSDYSSSPAGVLGVVGSAAPVAAFVELGTRPHTIRPKDAKALAFFMGGTAIASPLGVKDAFKVAKSVKHPGTDPNPVFARTLEQNTGQIIRRFEDAADAIARNLLG